MASLFRICGALAFIWGAASAANAQTAIEIAAYLTGFSERLETIPPGGIKRSESGCPANDPACGDVFYFSFRQVGECRFSSRHTFVVKGKTWEGESIYDFRNARDVSFRKDVGIGMGGFMLDAYDVAGPGYVCFTTQSPGEPEKRECPPKAQTTTGAGGFDEAAIRRYWAEMRSKHCPRR